MTTSREQRLQADGRRDAAIARLEQENAQLQHAVGSHATVDQALGVLAATHRLLPAAGLEVLREASQHIHVKQRTVADMVVGAGRSLPKPNVGRELDQAVRRRSRQVGAPGRPW